MVQKIRAIVFIFIGIIAIGLSIKCYTIKDLDYESKSMYGGDAFTGIQNAASQTSKNVKELAAITQFGFGSLLFVMGLTLVGIGLTTPMDSKKNEKDFSIAEEIPQAEQTEINSMENPLPVKESVPVELKTEE